MSWLSEFLHSPLDYLKSQPLKALSLIAAPLALAGGAFAAPALFGGAGLGAAGAGAAGGGALEGAGLGSALGFGEAAGGLGGGLAAGEGAGVLGGGDLLSSLGLGGAEFGDGALSAFASGAGEGAAEGGFPMAFGSGAEGMDAINWAASNFPSSGYATGEAMAGGFPTFGTEIGNPAMAGDFGLAGGGGSAIPSGVGGAAVGPGVELGTSGPLYAESPGFLSKLGTSAMDSVMKNPLGTALAGGGLAYALSQGQGHSANVDAAKASAASLNDQGKQLMSYLQSGTLPPGLKTAIDNATAGMRARIIANHARNGQSTNPSANSALAQELNQVDLNAAALIAQQGQQLLTTGMNATNMSNQLYIMLENLDRQQSQRTGQAIANFAAALSGPRLSVNLGGAPRTV